MRAQKPLIIGSDHAGVARKETIKKLLLKLDTPFIDIGSHDAKSGDDYPDIAQMVGEIVTAKKAKGILLCASGSGMAIAANKIPGVRAVAAFDPYGARMGRKDNDANILVLRSRNFPVKKYQPIIKAWLTTPFSKAARHKRRLKKVEQLERGRR